MSNLLEFKRRYTMAATPEPKTDTPEQKVFAAHLMPVLKVLETHAKPKMSPDAKALVEALLNEIKGAAESAGAVAS